MRALSLLFLLMGLLLLAGDICLSCNGNRLPVRSLGELLGQLSMPLPDLSNAAEGLPRLAAQALRNALDLPAFLLPVLLSVGFWFLRRRAPRTSRQASHTETGHELASNREQVPRQEDTVSAMILAKEEPHAPPARLRSIAARIFRRTSSGPIPPPLAKSGDTEFLPAALEILVTPPSPVAMRLIVLISSAVLTALAWSYFGRLDIYAVAAGKIQPVGRSKIIQPLEPGKIAVIHVENGAAVAAGQILLELDHTETAAESEAQVRDLESVKAEAVRRRAAIAAVANETLVLKTIAFPPEIGDSVRLRETAAATAELAELSSNLASLKAQVAEKAASKQRLKASIDARGRLIALTRERVSMREALTPSGAGSRASLIEALEQLENSLITDAGERGQMIETDAAIVSLQRKVELTIAQFAAQQTQKLVDAERKRDRLEEDVIKAASKGERTILRAPIAGTVQQLTVTSAGQVVTTGQSLLTIVPLSADIEVEALVPNKDIGFVKAGQQAVIKVEAFPFTRYGVIGAEVTKVSRDAVDERDTLTDAASAARPQGGGGASSGRPQSLVFPVTLTLARRSIAVGGGEVALSPGMAVNVEIKVGSRRAIDYVLSPLREMVSETAHEN